MKVLRVQDDTGHGPYTTEYQPPDVAMMYQVHQKEPRIIHPSPVEDNNIDRHMKAGERCGFASEDQLNAWFTETELEMLKANKFTVVTMEGDITEYGDCQVLFVPKQDHSCGTDKML